MLNMLEYKGTDTLYVIQIPIMDKWYTEYFYKIPWAEYRKIKFTLDFKSASLAEVKRHVIKHYTVRQAKYTDDEIEILPAGYAEALYSVIMELSDSGTLGNTPDELSLDKLNFKINIGRVKARRTIDIHMFTIICSVFKGYTFEALEKLSFDRICEIFAAAEKHMLDTGQLTNPIEFFKEGDNEDSEKDEDEDMKTALNFKGKKKTIQKEIEDEKPEIKDDNDILLSNLAKEAKRLSEYKPEQKEKEKEPELMESFTVKKSEIEELESTPVLSNNYSYYKKRLMSITKDEKELAKFENFIKVLESEYSPMQISKMHPQREKMQAKENERVQELISRNIEGYLEAKKNNEFFSTKGIEDNDFTGHTSYENMLAEAIESGIKPAGSEIIEARKRAEEKLKKQKEEEIIKREIGNKKVLTSKDIKRLKALKSQKDKE